MKRVIIVDFANLRDSRPGHPRGRRQREDGTVKNFAYADWEYIKSAIQHLKKAAPRSVIYLVSERSMAHEFSNIRDGARRLNAAAELPCDEYWQMYMMKTRREQAELRGDYDTKSNKGVRADDLILHLAAELDGFVLSGDFFSQPEYQELLKRIDHRVFYPTLSLDGTQWHFADSQQLAQLPFRERFVSAPRLRSLQETIAAAPLYSDSEIREIRERICGAGGLIDTFWLDYTKLHGVALPKKPRTKEPRSTRPVPGLKPGLTGTPFERLGELVGVLPPTVDGIDENSKLPLVLAIELGQLQGLKNRGAIIVGRVRSDGDTQFLEWYPGDRRIRLSTKRALAEVSPLEFVAVKGRVRIQDTGVVLEMPESTIVRVFSFAETSAMLIDEVSISPARRPRKWSLPRLPSRRRTGVVPRPIPTTPPPRPTTPPPRPTTPTVVPPIPLPPIIADVLPPEPSRVNARLVTSIAIAAAIATAIVGVVVSLVR
jgi:hypothetical protein